MVRWLSTVSFLLWTSLVFAQRTPEEDKLRRFYTVADGDRWINNTNWLTDMPLCSWFGVVCEGGKDMDEGVTALHLESNNLVGKVSKLVYELPKLRVLDLKDNYLTDGGFEAFDRADISQELEMIQLSENSLTFLRGIGMAPTSLRVLHITDNRLKEFPVELTNLTHVEQLFLSFNSMTGKLPTEIGTMSGLRQLFLYGNDLSGDIPSEIGMLDRLEIITLAENRFRGVIPRTVNNMLNLQTFSVHNNVEQKSKLRGKIPSFNRCVNLDEIYLGGNDFTGTIPSNFLHFSNRTDDLVTVSLANNNLDGTIPTELLKFNSLTLDITGNKITEIPPSLCDKGAWMSGLVERFGCDALLCPTKTYNPSGRQTTNDDKCLECPAAIYYGTTTCETSQTEEDWKILTMLYTKTQGSGWTNNDGWSGLDNLLQNADLDHLDGSALDICSWYGVSCEVDKVVGINLANNSLVGEVPLELFQLSALDTLDLSRNPLMMESTVGLSALGQSSSLTSLSLAGTKIASLVGIDHGQSLKKLYLDGIETDAATLPTEIFELKDLEILHMQYSYMTGTLPTLIGKMTGLVRLDLYNNELTGEIPSEIGLLTNLLSLELSENSFSGQLPAELSSLNKLGKLHIHQVDGKLSGNLPAFDTLPDLHELSLDSNQFTGPIAANFLGGVTNKNRAMMISLSFNKLNGGIPASLDSFTEMELKLEGNQINSIPPVLCDNDQWMNGEVGALGSSCDAILCPPQTYNLYGKASSSLNTDCQPCSSATFYGSTTCGAVDNPNPEKKVLDNLFTLTGGRFWTRSANWTTPGASICTREGIICAGNPTGDSGVTELRLNSNGLKGEIPAEIFTLPSARLLGFTDNEVTIKFDKIDQATSLRTLQLSNSRVTQFANLDKAPDSLAELHIASNEITGTFPTELFKLTALKNLFISNNLITGTIPTEIAKMSSLEQLWMAGSDFTGLIPPEIGSMVNLQKLDLARNYLSGNLPTELEDLVNLNILLLNEQLSDKKLSGPILSFKGSSALYDIDLSKNNFQGSIPDDFLDSVNTAGKATVVLSSNMLTGAVPENLSRFSNVYLDVTDNRITELSGSLCDQSHSMWMGDQVGQIGCDAILCPPGTALPTGRQTKLNEECAPCPGGTVDATFFGSVACVPSRTNLEREILRELYRRANGTNWLDQTNWMSDRNICTWYGVKCDENGLVELNLEENGLEATGDVSGTLFALPFLRKLDVKGNRLPLDFMKIPTSSPLQVLKVSATGLSSMRGISRARDMRRLHVTDNDLKGPIPDEIFDLTQLRSIYMSFNEFSGTLSADLGRLSNLEELYIFGNLVSGTLPAEAIPKLSILREFIMPENYLSGTVPQEFSQLASLEQLSLYDQKGEELITGKIPDFVGAPLLWYFDVTNNDLTGSIPPNFMQNSEYKNDAITIYMRNNEITGIVPASLDSFTNLDLEIAGNRITGVPDVLCDNDLWMEGDVGTVGGCEAIACPPGTYSKQGRQVSPDAPCEPCEYLQASGIWGSNVCADITVERGILMQIYKETGGDSWVENGNWGTNEPICSWEGVLCQDGDKGDLSGVTGIYLVDNNLVGTLPQAVWSLPFLQSLDVKDNRELHISFSGLDDAEWLELLYLSGTRVESLEGISGAYYLRELHITDCDLTGTLPNDLYELENLEQIYLAYNYFVGHISPRIADWVNLTDFYAYNNDFSGVLPTEIGEMENLENMVLSENFISGALPTELSILPSLRLLSIYRRLKPGPKLTGRLPSFDQNPSLTDLYLDHNDLTGPIPSNFLSASSSASLIDLSFNQLNETVPQSLIGLPELYLDLAANQISAFPPAVCDNVFWMDEDVATFGCKAFLCPPGTASSIGKQNETIECKDCPDPSVARFYGSVTCDEVPSERRTLVRLYQNTGGRGWYQRGGWLGAQPYCTWYGITCNKKGRISAINLGGNNLLGSPPPDLFTLQYLETLWLHSNPIGFSFVNIGAATRLTDLRLDSTGLKSVLGLDDAQSLMYLDLRFNDLEGTFPGELFYLGNLRNLNIGDNKLQGTLPDSFAYMPFLESLRLGSNKFTGSLPKLADSPVLRNVDFSDNKFSGNIPMDFLKLVNSRATLSIDLSSNELTGTVPDQLDRFDRMTIYLRENKIVGMPQVLCDNNNWNKGDVENFGCSGIVCQPGTYNMLGRERASLPCIACSDPSPYYGQVTCRNSRASSAQRIIGSLMAGVVAAIAGLYILA